MFSPALLRSKILRLDGFPWNLIQSNETRNNKIITHPDENSSDKFLRGSRLTEFSVTVPTLQIYVQTHAKLTISKFVLTVFEKKSAKTRSFNHKPSKWILCT